MSIAKDLGKIALITTLALASCKSPSYEGWVDVGNNKINCFSSDSIEYVEMLDKSSKVTGQYFYNKKQNQIDSIIYSQGRYKTKFNKKNFPEILKNRMQEFKDLQMKFYINHNLDSLFPEKKEE
jgi:hypothetical protein